MKRLQNYLANLEERQGVVAMKLAQREVSDKFLQVIQDRLSTMLSDLDRSTLQERGALDPEDKHALRAAVVADVERSVFLALAVYTMHVAEQLRLEVEASEIPYASRLIPVPSEAAVAEMHDRYGAECSMALKELPRMLASYDGELPPLGKITGGRLVPDRVQVEDWLRSRNGSLRPRVASASRAERHAALASAGRK